MILRIATDCLIVCALRPEASVIAGRIQGARRESIGGIACHRGLFAGRETLLARTGPGVRAAADGVEKILGETTPALLVNFGTAGAISDDLRPGDFLVSQTAQPYDPDFGDKVLTGKYRIADALAEQLAKISGVRFGSFGSADYSVADPIMRRRLRERHRFDAVDWETFSILDKASDFSIPAFALRVITDLAGPDAEEEFHNRHKRLVGLGAEELGRVLSLLK